MVVGESWREANVDQPSSIKGARVFFFLFISCACSCLFLDGKKEERSGKQRRDRRTREMMLCTQIALYSLSRMIFESSFCSLAFICRLCAIQIGTTRQLWTDSGSMQPRGKGQKRMCVFGKISSSNLKNIKIASKQIFIFITLNSFCSCSADCESCPVLNNLF